MTDRSAEIDGYIRFLSSLFSARSLAEGCGCVNLEGDQAGCKEDDHRNDDEHREYAPDVPKDLSCALVKKETHIMVKYTICVS